MGTDFQFWLPMQNGQFSFNSAWSQIRRKYAEFNQTNIIWGSKYAPKMSKCSLMVRPNKLNTKDKFFKWNNSIDLTCVLCSINHDSRGQIPSPF